MTRISSPGISARYAAHRQKSCGVAAERCRTGACHDLQIGLDAIEAVIHYRACHGSIPHF
jgi:hypothetical protein